MAIKDTRKQQPWKVTDHRFVGFIDIMGFKDRVIRSNHKDVYDMMKLVTRNINASINVQWRDGHTNELVKSTTYSDSIMIYSRDNSPQALDYLICTVSAFSNALFESQVPHKGAVAYGEMTLDEEESIYFGQPLIDAYLLQEEIQYYGILLHGSAELEFDKHVQNGHAFSFVEAYNCPLKSGNSVHETVYPIWTHTTLPEYSDNVELLKNAMHKLRYLTSGHLRKYVDNTETYLKYIRHQLESRNN